MKFPIEGRGKDHHWLDLRSRKNRIAAWRSFLTWCRSRGYLPDGDTVADKIDVPAIPRTTPATWTPDELAILIANVAPEYMPWLVLSAWAGLRTEEICPDPKSKKSPLLWSDFLWDRMLLIVRPETAKTGHRRVIPICPALAAMLPHDRVGRVGPLLPPHTPGHSSKEAQPPKLRANGKMTKGKQAYAGIPAETTRLGKLVGGWRRNALRHSFLSYRSAQCGSIAQAAREAGNSEAIARRVYEDAKGADEAEKWFRETMAKTDTIEAARAQFNIATLYFAKGDFTEAAKQFLAEFTSADALASARATQEESGDRPVTWWKSLLVLFAPVILLLVAMGFHLEVPTLQGFNFQGGILVAHPFTAMVVALSLYTAAFIAEIVRAGIQAISRGQSEAAFALGMRPGRTMNLIILPQALRVIIPPLISQYLNLTKNTSLGIAVSYLDLRGTLGGITLNQTGRELECMLLMMLIYLTISLIISALMNLYNTSVQIKAR
jgi:ABC-type amino acid transport system permease subunit/integrase